MIKSAYDIPVYKDGEDEFCFLDDVDELSRSRLKNYANERMELVDREGRDTVSVETLLRYCSYMSEEKVIG